MYRGFETSRTRTQQLLDGRWEFVTDPDDEGVDAGYPTSFPDDADRMAVPAAWNARPAYYDYHGRAWYRRTFSLPEPTSARLVFGGLAHDATVYLDGDQVAQHFGAYTPVEVVAGDLSAGTHEVVVALDNRLDETTIPLPESDWFPYGGVIREVVLEEVPDVHVGDVAVEYDLDGDEADLDVAVTVRNLGEATEDEVGVSVAGSRVAATVSIPAGESTVDLSGTVAGVERWSPDDPTLYDVVATAGDDEYRDRIGFREVSVTDTDVLVNGDPVEVLGVNRHEDHPEWGHAQPDRLMELDLDLIAEAGMNAVRTSHYPNHPRFLDYCDEAGLLVIEEIPYWQYDADDFARDPVLERGKTMLGELIERDRHHPSVFAWSLHNECYNHQEGVREATAELAATARDLDDSRPLTFASNTDWRGEEDVCTEYADFLCINGYWGWYRDDRDWTTFLSEIRESEPEKPILVSEFGAGAVEGERCRDGQKWSESYQADLLREAIETFRETEYVTGFTIWQYCDTRTTPRKWERRPKTKNNKGIVGEYRHPKEAYHAVSRLLSGSD